MKIAILCLLFAVGVALGVPEEEERSEVAVEDVVDNALPEMFTMELDPKKGRQGKKPKNFPRVCIASCRRCKTCVVLFFGKRRHCRRNYLSGHCKRCHKCVVKVLKNLGKRKGKKPGKPKVCTKKCGPCKRCIFRKGKRCSKAFFRRTCVNCYKCAKKFKVVAKYITGHKKSFRKVYKKMSRSCKRSCFFCKRCVLGSYCHINSMTRHCKKCKACCLKLVKTKKRGKGK